MERIHEKGGDGERKKERKGDREIYRQQTFIERQIRAETEGQRDIDSKHL